MILEKTRGDDALHIHAGGCIFSGALALTHLNRVVLDSNDRPVKKKRLLLDLVERIGHVIQSPEVWRCVSTDSGRILCIKPSSE